MISPSSVDACCITATGSSLDSATSASGASAAMTLCMAGSSLGSASSASGLGLIRLRRSSSDSSTPFASLPPAPRLIRPLPSSARPLPVQPGLGQSHPGRRWSSSVRLPVPASRGRPWLPLPSPPERARRQQRPSHQTQSPALPPESSAPNRACSNTFNISPATNATSSIAATDVASPVVRTDGHHSVHRLSGAASSAKERGGSSSGSPRTRSTVA